MNVKSTRTFPSEDGFYIARMVGESRNRIVRVYKDTSQLFVEITGDTRIYDLDDFHWYGKVDFRIERNSLVEFGFRPI